eukprot:10066653-Alexandrium_andersonii.AAC.1
MSCPCSDAGPRPRGRPPTLPRRRAISLSPTGAGKVRGRNRRRVERPPPGHGLCRRSLVQLGVGAGSEPADRGGQRR